MRVMKTARQLSVLALAATFAAGIPAQSVVYPAKGQKPEQQKKDEGECHTWAVGNSKYDPTNPPKQAAAPPPPTTATGSTPGAGVRGAARGAVVGEVVGGDASSGAAAGARGENPSTTRGATDPRIARRNLPSAAVDCVTSNSRNSSSGMIGKADRLARNADSSKSRRRSAPSASASQAS